MEAREIAQESLVLLSLRLMFNLHFLTMTGSFVRVHVPVPALSRKRLPTRTEPVWEA